jgi:RNA polymerase sigma-70 factor (ECF subfamily)
MLDLFGRSQETAETAGNMTFSAPIEEDKAGEDKLVLAAAKGNLEAFNRLVEIYEQRVFGLAYRLLNDREAAADATQDSFFQAYRALNQYRGGSFKSWLFRITSNICYDRLRSRKRRPTTSLEEMLVEAENSGGNAGGVLEDPDSDPGDKVLKREIMAELNRAMAQLPPEQKIVVVLSDVQGMTYEEIASITGASLGTVKSRLSRGRAKIRELLQKYGTFD